MLWVLLEWSDGALRHASVDNYVPAHRVVNRHGELSGRNYFSSPSMMQELLEQEGIQVEDNRIIDFESKLWKPVKRTT